MQTVIQTNHGIAYPLVGPERTPQEDLPQVAESDDPPSKLMVDNSRGSVRSSSEQIQQTTEDTASSDRRPRTNSPLPHRPPTNSPPTSSPPTSSPPSDQQLVQ